MDKWRQLRWKFCFLLVASFILIVLVALRPPQTYRFFPKVGSANVATCSCHTSEGSITSLNDTKHMLVSAFLDQRVKDWDVRIIGIFRRDSIQPLYCVFCSPQNMCRNTTAKVLQHSDNFGFPFVTTDVMCKIPRHCNPTAVTLTPHTDVRQLVHQVFLPLRKRESRSKPQFNFTVCISTLFGDYNNVLQFTQALEMYRLLGVNRVVVYNTSCGPDLDQLLRGYSQEGFVEVVPWPIDRFLNPSRGWQHSQHGGDVHYFGQLTTLNECTYRYMDRSRYVLLNDIDEIIVPYQHNNLMSLMDMLQNQRPEARVFLIENHIFPKEHFEPSGRFHLPQWEGVPGDNILEHVYREEPNRKVYHPHKIIVQPRAVEQTSVHSVLKNFGEVYKVPPSVCRIVHVRVPLQGSLTIDELHVDKRLWDFSEKLVPKVDEALRRAGLLSSQTSLSNKEGHKLA